jgi:hypothetical protein
VADNLSLVQLQARFLRIDPDGEGFREVPSIELAQGVMFLCPKCFAEKRGPAGCHQVICWSRSAGAPDEVKPGPGRWKMDGHGIGDLTLNAEVEGGARSVQLHGGCEWHGFVANGMAA